MGKRIPVSCFVCGTVVLRMPSRIKSKSENFCGYKCSAKFRADISKQKANILKICKECGNEFTVRKSEHKKFTTCSEECRRLSRKNEKNPNWQGGKTIERQKAMAQQEYKLWRKSVFERDNHTCRECGKRGGNMEAHHIKSWKNYPELRYEITNGVTLCLKCHRKTFKNLL